MEKAMPANVSAERATLGAILMDREAILDVKDWLYPAHFDTEKHAWVYEAGLACVDRQPPVPPDLQTVAEELRRRDRLEAIGGIPYLIDLSNAVPTSFHIGYYARIVERTAVLRRIIQAGGRIAALGFDESIADPEQVLEAADDELRAIREGRRVAGRSRSLLHADRLDELPPLEFLLDQYLVAHGLNMIYGPSGTKKSFLAFDWAAQVAQRAPVVYCPNEGQAGYRARRDAWKLHNKSGIGQMFFWRDELDLMNANSVAQFIATAREAAPALVVIDTLSGAMPTGDDASGLDMGMALAGAKRIKDRLGCAVLLVHHTGLAGTHSRGSTKLPAALDLSVRLEPKEDQIAVYCAKAKDFAEWPVRYMKSVLVPAASSLVLVPAAQVMSSPGDRLSDDEVAILEILNNPIYRQFGLKHAELAAQTGIPKSSLSRLLGQLKAVDGYVRQDSKKGDPFFITGDGVDALQESYRLAHLFQHGLEQRPLVPAPLEQLGPSNSTAGGLPDAEFQSVPSNSMGNSTVFHASPPPLKGGGGGTGIRAGSGEARPGQVEHAWRLLREQGPSAARQYVHGTGGRDRYPSDFLVALDVSKPDSSA